MKIRSTRAQSPQLSSSLRELFSACLCRYGTCFEAEVRHLSRFPGYALLILILIVFASSATSWHVRLNVPERTKSALINSRMKDDFRNPTRPSILLTGKYIFENACAACHGSPKNPDFHTDLSEHSPRDIYQLVTWGRSTEKPDYVEYSGSPYSLKKNHPAFPVGLSDSERWAVSIYMYSSASVQMGDADYTRWIENWRNYYEGVGELNPPKEIFDMFCSVCHGPLGYGNGRLAADLIPPPRDFSDTSWLSSQSDLYLNDVIRDGKIIDGSNWEKQLDKNAEMTDKSWTGMPWWGDYLREN
ncbi:MAG TPA: hypothetical protein ENN67_05670, partial [Firmicutes bacterium]|nr:hypothetical protein [Bacillota bacterium]